MCVVLKQTNQNLSGDTGKIVFESLQEEIQGALYLPSHESQCTQVTNTKY